MAGSREIEQTAAAWLARRDRGHWSAHNQAQLDAWLDAATAHRVAFIRLDSAWQQSDRLKVLRAGQPAGAVPARGSWSPRRFGTLDDAPASMVSRRPSAGSRHRPGTAFPSRTSVVAPDRATAKSRRPWSCYPAVLAAAAVLIVVLTLGWRHYNVVDQASFQTGIGDLQKVPLADGSTATLSSNSRIVVTFSRRERHVELQHGEAFFSVVKDPGRPFVVSADGRRVTAVGTRFAVRRDQAGLRVIVTRGVVRLEPGRDDGRSPCGVPR